MRRKTFHALWNIRQSLIETFLADENKATRKEINRLIKSLTRIIDKEISCTN